MIEVTDFALVGELSLTRSISDEDRCVVPQSCTVNLCVVVACMSRHLQSRSGAVIGIVNDGYAYLRIPRKRHRSR